MRFEYFLQLLKSADFIVGNSSAGVREAAYFGVPAINIGSRQRNRHTNDLILDVDYQKSEILSAIESSFDLERTPSQAFGDGKSGEKFARILAQPEFWPVVTDKQFVDVIDLFGGEK
jgi:UDP-N-acetylglucosamine 2-epimerase (hydrolysing)